jgi:hypothetical protein
LPNPKNIRKRSTEEESALCSMDDNVKKFLDFIKSKDCKIGCKPKFIRELYALSKNIQPSLFVKGIERALIYKIENIDSIQRIISQLLKNESIAAIEIMGHNDYQNRKSYQLGLFSEENDLNEYQKMIDKNDDL